MNPIMEAILAQIDAGKQISRVTMDKPYQPSKVILQFADNTLDEFPIQCDHKTFMVWWKHTRRYIKLMGLIKPLEE